MMKSKKIILIKKLIVVILLSMSFLIMQTKSLFSANVLTKEALVKRIQNFFKKTKTITGNFTLIKGRYVERGVFFYKSPNKFKMIFGYYAGGFKIETKTILMDGDQLWAYLPSIKAVVDQDIKKISGNIAYSGSGLGIRRLINKYNYSFYKGDNSLKTEAGLKSKVRVLRLFKPRSFTGFKEILLFVRNDGFIAKARAITIENQVFELIRTNIKLNVDIDNKHFVFRVPKDAQIFRNPLVSGK